MLPQFVAFGAMLAACWFVSRWVRQEVSRVDSDMKRAQRILQRRASAVPQLRFDPMTGHYHPVD